MRFEIPFELGRGFIAAAYADMFHTHAAASPPRCGVGRSQRGGVSDSCTAGPWTDKCSLRGADPKGDRHTWKAQLFLIIREKLA